jgi:hypothetical protein
MTDNNPFAVLNTDRRREEIIFGEAVGIERKARFAADEYAPGDPISPTTAQTLLNEGYVAPDIGQNRAPSARSLLETARSYDERTSEDIEAYLCGYVIPEPRPDARVMFTTLRLESANRDIPESIKADIRSAFTSRPDELYTTDSVVRCWWD